jgi:hypothetical protein
MTASFSLVPIFLPKLILLHAMCSSSQRPASGRRARWRGRFLPRWRWQERWRELPRCGVRATLASSPWTVRVRPAPQAAGSVAAPVSRQGGWSVLLPALRPHWMRAGLARRGSSSGRRALAPRQRRSSTAATTEGRRRMLVADPASAGVGRKGWAGDALEKAVQRPCSRIRYSSSAPEAPLFPHRLRYSSAAAVAPAVLRLRTVLGSPPRPCARIEPLLCAPLPRSSFARCRSPAPPASALRRYGPAGQTRPQQAISRPSATGVSEWVR